MADKSKLNTFLQSLSDMKYVRTNNPAGIVIQSLPEEDKKPYRRMATTANLIGMLGGALGPVNSAAAADIMATAGTAGESWGGWLLASELMAPGAVIGAKWGMDSTPEIREKKKNGTFSYLDYFR